MSPHVQMPRCLLCETPIEARCRVCLGWFCRDCTLPTEPGICEHTRYEPSLRNDNWYLPPPLLVLGAVHLEMAMDAQGRVTEMSLVPNHPRPRPYVDGGVPWEGPQE